MNATAADILYLKPRYGAETPADALPASLEFKGPHGMINYFLWGAPTAALLARQEVAALEGGLQSLKLLENEEDGTWKLAMHGTNMDIPPVEYPIEWAEVEAVLAANGIGMPGREQPAAAPAPDGDADPADDPNAPPF